MGSFLQMRAYVQRIAIAADDAVSHVLSSLTDAVAGADIAAGRQKQSAGGLFSKSCRKLFKLSACRQKMALHRLMRRGEVLAHAAEGVGHRRRTGNEEVFERAAAQIHSITVLNSR